ncbi:MAG TPA: hypothetical protein EYN66_23735 [Myxococcales bacterium]|nr:hypothetical protein [Myxococcales bacterium]
MNEPAMAANMKGAASQNMAAKPSLANVVSMSPIKNSAVASLLKSPGAGARQAKLLLAGFAIAATYTALSTYGFVPDMLDFNETLGLPYFIPVAVSLSFANFGAGLLSGRGGLAFAVGGVLAWWIISPIAVQMGWLPDAAMQYEQGAWQDSGTLYGTMIRPLGIGMLIGGALMGVILSIPALKSALKGLSSAVQARSASTGPSQELSSRVMTIGLGASVMVLFAAAMFVSAELTLIQGIMVAVVGTLWLGLAGLVVAQATGMTDISPMSGMALIGVTLMFFVTAGNVIASVMLGVAVCVGIGQCADMMQDLKTGHLVGSVPKRQQIVQFAVAWIGAPAAVLTVFVLWGGADGMGGGFGPGTELTAPQAGALQAILDGLSQGDVPLDKYIAGTGLGCALAAFPIGGIGVLIGLAMYLPFYITFGYGIGCLASMALQKKHGKKWISGTLVPVAAGFIVGEALTSLVITIVKLTVG